MCAALLAKFCTQSSATLIFGILHRSLKRELPATATSFALPRPFFNKQRFRFIAAVSSASIDSQSFLCNSTPCTAHVSARLNNSAEFFSCNLSNLTTVINESAMSTNHPSPLARQSSAKKQKTEHEQDEDGIPIPEVTDLDYVNLTTHADTFGIDPVPISWGHPDPLVRGPVICTVRHYNQRNAIGAHSGSYCIYTGLAVAAGKLSPDYVPNLKLTSPVFKIGPYPSWNDPKKIASIDPFGHLTTEAYGAYLDKGFDIRPTIAVTKAHIDLPECREAVRAGRLKPDGKILMENGQSVVWKAAIEPVWYLPEIARRFGCTESHLRQSIFRMTNGMYPELITRPDIKIFLPPIGGLTIYIWGDPDTIPDEDIELTCRVHDECNGSDVFGSDICTCRPYLTHAIEEAIKTAQRGGAGLVIYYRKEGRSLGEVTKYLVYNTRKRQEGGDSAENYFNCTEQVAGVQDTRFQALMPDPLHFLGVTKIHNFISMSDMKYNAIVGTGIKIVNRIEIPKELVPQDAQVEITAKVFHGYNAGKAYQGIDEEELKKCKGREYNYDGSSDGANDKEGGSAPPKKSDSNIVEEHA